MAKVTRPKWWSNPVLRSERLKTLAEKGVPRMLLRIACGCSNNQMAGATTKAEFKFSDYKVASREKIRIALQEANFGDALIDKVMAAYRPPEVQKPDTLWDQKRSDKSQVVALTGCGVIVRPPVSRILAANEATQCPHRDEVGHRCGYEMLADEDSCGRKGHRPGGT